MTGQKQPENVQYFKYLRSRISNAATTTRDGKSVTALAKEAFNKKEVLYIIKLDKFLRAELVMCYIWGLVLCGAETRILRNAGQETLGSFEMWYWKRMEKISLTDRARNQEVLQKGEEYPTNNKKKES